MKIKDIKSGDKIYFYPKKVNNGEKLWGIVERTMACENVFVVRDWNGVIHDVPFSNVKSKIAEVEVPVEYFEPMSFTFVCMSTSYNLDYDKTCKGQMNGYALVGFEQVPMSIPIVLKNGNSLNLIGGYRVTVEQI
jgi:hypothetical protein